MKAISDFYDGPGTNFSTPEELVVKEKPIITMDGEITYNNIKRPRFKIKKKGVYEISNNVNNSNKQNKNKQTNIKTTSNNASNQNNKKEIDEMRQKDFKNHCFVYINKGDKKITMFVTLQKKQ